MINRQVSMFNFIKALGFVIAVNAGAGSAFGDIVAVKTTEDLTKPPPLSAFSNAKEETVTLMAQPMAIPRPKVTTTAKIQVRAIHNEKWIAFSLRWSDAERNDAGKLAEFSDAVAVQFPVKDQTQPPPIFMGAKGNPVHIYHWRSQYQVDKEKGKRTIKDIYPNMNVDMYPMEFPDMGTVLDVDESVREVYSYGKAAGNPQSYAKKGVDEIIAEGYGTSSVVENVMAESQGVWEKGEWNVVITRPLKRDDASVLEVGKGTFVAFAVWQGSQDEVGSRKSVTMAWTPVNIQ